MKDGYIDEYVRQWNGHYPASPLTRSWARLRLEDVQYFAVMFGRVPRLSLTGRDPDDVPDES